MQKNVNNVQRNESPSSIETTGSSPIGKLNFLKKFDELEDFVEIQISHLNQEKYQIEISVTMYLKDLGLQMNTDPTLKQKIYRSAQLKTENNSPYVGHGVIKFDSELNSLIQRRMKASLNA